VLAHLVDAMPPRVPVRQWVLTVCHGDGGHEWGARRRRAFFASVSICRYPIRPV